jgi:hypothetical protein
MEKILKIFAQYVKIQVLNFGAKCLNTDRRALNEAGFTRKNSENR